MLLPLRLNLKTFRPLKQHIRLLSGLVLQEVSIKRRKTSQATGEQGTEQQVSSAETGGFWEDLEIGQDPHVALQSRFSPASGSVISCSLESPKRVCLVASVWVSGPFPSFISSPGFNFKS